MRPRLRALLALLLSLPAAAQIPDSLTALNDAFRQAYAGARRRVLAGDGPLLIVNGDTAALIRGASRSDAPINGPAYHVFKTIAHIPLAIFVALTPGEGTLDPDHLKTLEDLRRLIPPARAGLDGLGLAPADLARQDQIVRESLAFLDETVAQRRFARKDLESFTRRMSPLVLANVVDAARVQLDILHAQVSAWRREMPPREWEALHVLIITAHMPREESLHVQYFSRLLNEPVEGRRIVVAESLFEEPKALDLYGTHLLDGRIGQAFFGDPLRMHRDLLAEAAKEYLRKILP
jgi:hypothetical protein